MRDIAYEMTQLFVDHVHLWKRALNSASLTIRMYCFRFNRLRSSFRAGREDHSEDYVAGKIAQEAVHADVALLALGHKGS